MIIGKSHGSGKTHCVKEPDTSMDRPDLKEKAEKFKAEYGIVDEGAIVGADELQDQEVFYYAE